MSTVIEVLCEDPELQFDTHPELKRDAVLWNSTLLPQLLFPHLRLAHYDGLEGGLFAYLREREGISSVLEDLLEQDQILVNASTFVLDLVRLQGALLTQRANLPPIFELADAKGQVYLEISTGSQAIECGYNHCVLISADSDGVADLRRVDEVTFANKILQVRRIDTYVALEPELRSVLVVARTAMALSCRIELRVL